MQANWSGRLSVQSAQCAAENQPRPGCRRGFSRWSIGMAEPAFDTSEWREIRDQKLRAWIGNEDAVRLVLDIADAFELWDDLIDDDSAVYPSHIHRVFWSLVTQLPVNPFWERHKENLIPVLVAGMNAWHDANELEGGSANDQAIAYTLRDFYLELVPVVIYLTRGRDYMRSVSLDIRRFFTRHESLESYREGLK